MIQYAQKLIYNAGVQIIIIDAIGELKNNANLKERIRAIEQKAPNHIAIRNESALNKAFLENQDLMLISLDSWKKLVDTKSLWLSDIPSTLIIANKREN